MLSIGFTGTRNGMTPAQYHAVRHLVSMRSLGVPFYAHHGDCTGADAEFHQICESFCGRGLVTVHPGPVDDVPNQAGCVGVDRCAPVGHMKRNRNIIKASTVMIAAPANATEQPHSGVWATIHLARRASKPLAIVLPSGDIVKERWP